MLAKVSDSSSLATARARARIVILGGGLRRARRGQGAARGRRRVTLIDRRNHHLFQPLLYQVATAALSAARHRGADPPRAAPPDERRRCCSARRTSIDVEPQRVLLDAGTVDYDYLIVATGATHSYFGHDEWAPFAPGLKTVEDALEIRRRVLFAYEVAERERRPARARACADLRRRRRRADRRRARRRARGDRAAHAGSATSATSIRAGARGPARGGPRVLSDATPKICPTRRARQLADARRRGARRHDGHAIDAEACWLGSERHRGAHRAVGRGRGGLAARAQPRRRRSIAPVASTSTPDLSVPGHDEVFVIGDLARLSKTARRSPASRRPRSRRGATRPPTSCARCAVSRANRSAIATRARSPRSAASRRRRDRAACTGLARSHGSHGCSSTSLPDRLSQPAARDARLGVGLRDPRPRRAAHHR